MFQNLLLHQAALWTTVIAVGSAIIGTILRIQYGKRCSIQYADEITKRKVKSRLTVLRFFILLLFSVSGTYIGNLINIGTGFYTAVTHGMTPDPNTGQYYLKYGEILALNRTSVKESDIDIKDLKNKAIIYVRYDCPDCAALHDQIAELDDMIFLSSKTEKGKAARELYNINLTEIPQGVYIDPAGNATTLTITQGSGDTLSLDLHQLNILRALANQEP